MPNDSFALSTAGATKQRRQKLVKRACDPCKVRKIKCSEISPCTGCIAAGIECTFNRAPAVRGPRNLRAKTIHRIASERQDGGTQIPSSGRSSSSQSNDYLQQGDDETEELPGVLQLLNIYAARLFPIWPIVDAVDLANCLIANPRNERARHLAHAVALATIAQLKLVEPPWRGIIDQVEHDAQRGLDAGDLVDSLRVSFFLHICHENETSGGIKSLVYLREAITKAQILRIDREASFSALQDSEQQLLRRLVWLLFVTERGVAMLHKLPVILRPSTIFPWSTNPSSDRILPSFLKLVHLFYNFDQSGIFELLRNSDADVTNMETLARGCLEGLQRKLQDDDKRVEGDGDRSSGDVQRADMYVTKQWMRAVLWKAGRRFGVVVDGVDPIRVAGEFLALVSQLPTAALESQGPTLEFKTYEIATAVVDAVENKHPMTVVSHPAGHPGQVIMGLHRILASSRGGNMTLLALLNSKLATANPDLRILVGPPTAVVAELPVLHQQQPPIQWDTSMMNAFLNVSNQEQADEEELADLSWAPYDLGNMLNMLRSPSPMTQMLIEGHQQAPI